MMRIRHVLCGMLAILLAASGLLPGARPAICEEERNESDRLIRASRQLQQIAEIFGERFSDEDAAAYRQRQRIFETIIEAPDFDGISFQVETGGVEWVETEKQQLGYKLTGGLTCVTCVQIDDNFLIGGKLDKLN